jgi:hypothetical protein
MPRTTRIRDLRRRSKTRTRLVFLKDGVLRGVTTQPSKDNNVTRIQREEGK